MKNKEHIPFEESRHFLWTDIPIGILFTILFISVGLSVALFFRPLYYANIGWQDLESVSGLTEEVIKENYDALIDYCSPFSFSELSFPSLPSSEDALSHFEDVKVIFNAIFIAGFISLVSCITIIILKRRKKQYSYLLVSAITALVLPVIIGLGSAISFDAVFTIFHKLAFSNDNWLFDPATDPIILLLPENYFLQCALVIIVVVLIGCAICFLRYRSYKRRERKASLLPTKKNYIY